MSELAVVQTKISPIEKIVKSNLSGVENKQNEIERLVHGKDATKKIVNVEINDDEVTLFIEQDGKITQETRPNRFWILSAELGTSKHSLAGMLNYKWGYQFKSQKDWHTALNRFKKTNADVYTIYDPREAYLVKDGVTYFKGMKHTEPSILSFDIESTGLFHNDESRVLLISNTFRKNGRTERKLFAYDSYTTQGEMLTDWCRWVRGIDPSIIAGHNIYTYDLPYLQFIAVKEGITLDLGRDGSPLVIKSSTSKFRIDGSREQDYRKCRVYGRELIDTYFLAIKHDIATKKYESYGLKQIIKQEGLERADRVHYDSSQIRFNYTKPEEWAKIKEYCIHDSDDALAVYDLTSPATFYLTQSIPKPFQVMVESATGSQINAMMVRSYLQDGHSIPKATTVKKFAGGISFGNPGIYHNVHKIDVAGMYPSIILACKVYDEDKDPNGNFLKIMEAFTAERIKNKRLAKETGDPYYEGLQNSQKIVVNSGYGFMGAPGLQFNSVDAAEFITSTGRDVLKGALGWADSMGFNVPNADTDSISYCKRDGSVISKLEQEENLRQVNALLPERIRFEDDGYYKTVVVCAGKNYILDDGKKVKIKGSALKASTKSAALKEMLGKFIASLVAGRSDYLDIYNSYVKEACKVTDMKRWAARKTISHTTLTSERANETRIKDAIEGSEFVEGDRVWMFNRTDTELALVDKFDGNYSVAKLLQQVYDTVWIFDEVIDCESLFINYKNKGNKIKLKELLGE